MKNLFFKIIILAIAAMAAVESAGAMGWKTWIFPPELEERIEKAVKVAYGDRHVEVTFVENDLVASCVDCVTGKDDEYVQLKIYSSGCVKLNWTSANRALSEKVRVGVQKVFTEKGAR